MLGALQWLQLNNPFYANITIDHIALQALPCDAIPPELQTIESEQNCTTEETVNPEVPCSSRSFLPVPIATGTEDEAIRTTFEHSDPFDWPCISNSPINELRMPGLASQVFPTLFPYGKGDRTFPGHHCQVTLTDLCFQASGAVRRCSARWFILAICYTPTFPLLGFEYEATTSAHIYLKDLCICTKIQQMLTSPLMISGTWLVVSVPNISCVVFSVMLSKVHGTHPYWFQRYKNSAMAKCGPRGHLRPLKLLWRPLIPAICM